MTTKPDIKTLVSPLLNEQLAEEQVKEIITAIHKIYDDFTGITGYAPDDNFQEQIHAKHGKAISINQAARCLFDHRRTAQFFRAMIQVIRDKQELYPATTIQILYAGCGPYAPFLTMIAPLFQPEEVQFTLLEINKLSLVKAKQLTKSLGLEDYVKDYRHADAVTYKLPEGEHYHILFTETLDAALRRECFVPILLNLLPQLDTSTTLIPENVILDASLIKQEDLPKGDDDIRDIGITYPERPIGEIFNVKEVLKPYLEKGEHPVQFPTKQFKIDDWESFDYLIIYTRVQVYKNFWLTRGEGFLGEPQLSETLRVIYKKDIRFTYYLEPDVEMEIES